MLLPLQHSSLQIQQSLSRPLTILSCSLYTASYVGSLYLFRATRVGGPSRDESGQPLTRDHPKVIKARIAGVLASTVLSILGTHVWVEKTIRPKGSLLHHFRITATLLGFTLPNEKVKGLLYPLVLTALLFLGPLYTLLLDRSYPAQENFSYEHSIKKRFLSLAGLRTYVAGPISEEIVFRACILTTSVLSQKESLKQMIFLSPLYFGIAHVHHAYEVYHNSGKTRNALISGIISSSFQFVYTSLFGWYSSYLFLRSASIFPPLLAHVFCNIMGFPQLPIALHEHPNRKISIWVAYLAGVAGFVKYFSALTAVDSVFGGSMYWG